MIRQTWAEIDLQAIKKNIRAFRTHLPAEKEIMAVVKANGYGHGAVRVAQSALQAGASWLAVALLEEALELRDAGVQAPMLVLGYTPPEYASLAQEKRISLTAVDVEHLVELSTQVEPQLPALGFHFKVDTGMSRFGINTHGEIEQAVHLYQTRLRSSSHLLWEGLYTHLATADEEDTTYTQAQVLRFKRIQVFLKQQKVPIKYYHAANSAGTVREFDDLETNMVRVGISMYGLYPSEHMKTVFPFTLTPSFSLHTRLSQVKQLAPSTGVSYGKTYMTEKPEWVGVIPIGYADGYSRNLSNQAQVLIRGQKHPIIGRICMDSSVVRLHTRLPRSEIVTLIGRQQDQAITADDLAHILGTINYEIPCMIGERVPRVYK
ncbi:alanine racemase [Caldalkalibacillus salinus]|uniref:alanine racemase n=1 Tax=Caldalkalibacillus salinus TaxID=2803787 RepID=UPI001921DAF0|nr:alanine racemase [Caldalkalibacillus salinus]